jgi:hypothetical protein
VGRPRLKKQQRPAGSAPMPPRTFRAPDDVWDAARDRADTDGLTISHVLVLLLQGYISGEIRVQMQKARARNDASNKN